MQEQLAHAVSVIHEQDRLIQFALLAKAAVEDKTSTTTTSRSSASSLSPPSRLELSELEELMETLTHEKQALAIAAENMNDERSLFTEQAQKLDQERLAFEVRATNR
jgi:hypothetical protein